MSMEGANDSDHRKVMSTEGANDSDHRKVMSTEGANDSAHKKVMPTEGANDSADRKVMYTEGANDSAHKKVMPMEGANDSADRKVMPLKGTNNSAQVNERFGRCLGHARINTCVPLGSVAHGGRKLGRMYLPYSRPDMTIAVDWALKATYLSICPVVFFACQVGVIVGD